MILNEIVKLSFHSSKRETHTFIMHEGEEIVYLACINDFIIESILNPIWSIWKGKNISESKIKD